MGYGRKNRFLELSRNQYGIDSAMFRKMVIFKAGIDFVLGSYISPSRATELILWNRYLRFLKVLKFGLCLSTSAARGNEGGGGGQGARIKKEGHALLLSLALPPNPPPLPPAKIMATSCPYIKIIYARNISHHIPSPHGPSLLFFLIFVEWQVEALPFY